MDEFVRFGESGHAALIGDVVGSRHVAGRSELQRQLRARLEGLNLRLRDALSCPLVLLRGDEIQGLFHRPEAIVKVVVELAEHLYPVALAYGLGFGAVTTDLVPDVSAMDGPCFHHARSALEEARKSRAWVLARGFGDAVDERISAIFQLMGAVRSRWTARQVQIVQAARSSLQKDVAARLEVSRSVVSESLKAAFYPTIREGEAAVEHFLAEFGNSARSSGAMVAEPNPSYGGDPPP